MMAMIPNCIEARAANALAFFLFSMNPIVKKEIPLPPVKSHYR